MPELETDVDVVVAVVGVRRTFGVRCACAGLIRCSAGVAEPGQDVRRDDLGECVEERQQPPIRGRLLGRPTHTGASAETRY